jgi:3-oxoacyl-[acyl-carrier-protein] synthase-3
MQRSIITGTGCYIPPVVQTNTDFAKHLFYTEEHVPLPTPPAEVVEKFKQITGIEERRYTTDDLSTADIAAIAAKEAIANSGVDVETLDQIIVAMY